MISPTLLSGLAYSTMITKETGAAPATFVPAGVVTVTRTQERGYALVSIG